ncbi:hypothetical protein NPIL_160161 [Nephila pilipes]|uniref:Uncharacterized protein n=1 Tax=Nephila pilipes TaxID=299642 RepID=A0A8X6NW47_NEPPI|nr:hypothetical protein NPIL_160161 [Nephila pilipes]
MNSSLNPFASVLEHTGGVNNTMFGLSPGSSNLPNNQSVVATNFTKHKNTNNVLFRKIRMLIKSENTEWQEVRNLMDVGNQGCVICKTIATLDG